MTTPLARRRDARRALEADLARLLDPDALMVARVVLARDRRLAGRAVDAELRQPGSGAFAVTVSILKQRRAVA